MPVITRLQQQKRDKERVNVYLDGEFAFGLNVLDAASLRTGQDLSDAEIDALRRKDAVVEAVNYGAQLLSYRPRSTQEIRRKMQQKRLTEATITAAIDRMKELGYLDDRAFARFWIENRSVHKPRGPHALRHELRQKGISSRIIDELVETMLDEEQAAYDAAQARVRRLRGTTPQVFKQKIGAYLQRRGFNTDVILQTVTTLIDDLQADDPAFFAEPTETDDDIQ